MDEVAEVAALSLQELERQIDDVRQRLHNQRRLLAGYFV
jgi:hypothetical protein